MSRIARIATWLMAWLVAALFPCPPAAGQEPATLKLMTYNIRYASDQPPNAWPVRRPLVKKLLVREAADAIGMQEAVYRQVKDLEQDLPGYGWIGLGRDGGSRGEFMAVFYKRARLEPLEFDHFWLSDTPDVVGSTTWGNTNRRMVTWVRFRDQQTKGEFYFFNTHFDHQVQPAREKSAQLVRDRVEKLATRLPVILLGDFNAVAGANKAYELLVGDGAFVDLWDKSPKKGPQVDTFNSFKAIGDGGRRIDWILGRGAVDVHEMAILTDQENGQFPSDHFPVTAQVTLGAAP